MQYSVFADIPYPEFLYEDSMAASVRNCFSENIAAPALSNYKVKIISILQNLQSQNEIVVTSTLLGIPFPRKNLTS